MPFESSPCPFTCCGAASIWRRDSMKATMRSASTVAWWWFASRSAPSRLFSSASADASSSALCCLGARHSDHEEKRPRQVM
jgi:hypothetical protein